MIFVFDASYPSIDLALPIDESKQHVIISNTLIEPPPGHQAVKLDYESGVRPIFRNVRQLRAVAKAQPCDECLVIVSPKARREQIVWNTLYACLLSRKVRFFDGSSFKSFRATSKLLVRNAAVTILKLGFSGALRNVKVWRKRSEIRRAARAAREHCSDAANLFGIYTSKQSFSLPPDDVSLQPDGPSLYGTGSNSWYLPALSHRRQRFETSTTRHTLRNVALHAELVDASEVSALFCGKKMLDYPYLLGRNRDVDTYQASTCSKSFRAARGICMLAFSSGYYHWLLEGVPRILDLIDDGTDFDRYPLILPPLTSFHREFLQLFDIDPQRHVLTVSPGEWCWVDDCIFPTLPFPFAAPEVEDPSGQPSRTLLERIQQRVLDRLYKLEGRRVGLPTRLYISRAKAAKRKFTPQIEVAVSSALGRAGYTTVFLEELDWHTQVHLLAGADAIAGLHGAGLANMLFSNARCLLEFQNPLETRGYFAVMARELGIRYRYLIGGLEGESSNFDNITLNTQRLQAALQAD